MRYSLDLMGVAGHNGITGVCLSILNMINNLTIGVVHPPQRATGTFLIGVGEESFFMIL